MRDEFLKIARQEIQSEIDNLRDILLECTNDEQLYKKSRDVVRHMHKIKGLAPMMNQDKIGEIARISETILKYVTNHGTIKNSQMVILEANQRMSNILEGHNNNEFDNFRKKVRDTLPEIVGI